MTYHEFKGLLFVMGFDVRTVDGDSAFIARLAEPTIIIMAVGDWVNSKGDKPLKPFMADVFIPGQEPKNELMYTQAVIYINLKISGGKHG